MQKSLPQGSPPGQAIHAIQSLRRTMMFPSGAVVAATAKIVKLWASLISAGSENCAATSKTKRK
jgi:hypothetical protein